MAIESIETHERLAVVGTKLGLLQPGKTHKDFMNLALQSGIQNPVIVLAQTWKHHETVTRTMQDGEQTVHLMSNDADSTELIWHFYLEVHTLWAKVTPEVWAIDSSRFTAPF